MSSPASADPDPTPTLASNVRATAASDPRVALQQRFSAAFGKAIEAMDLSTYDEIHQRYSDDPERELNDIQAGRHPWSSSPSNAA